MGSHRVMGPIPELPWSRFSQKTSAVKPRGVIAPMPVMTTLGRDIPSHSTQFGIDFGRNALHHLACLGCEKQRPSGQNQSVISRKLQGQGNCFGRLRRAVSPYPIFLEKDRLAEMGRPSVDGACL